MDLNKFCGNDELRPYLNKPFSFGDFTYATNGHIMVRVPRRADVPDQTKEGKWDSPMKGLEDATFSPLQHKALPPIPPAVEVDCSACDGRGTDHDCPDCDCTCWDCGGKGRCMARPKITTTIRGCIYNLEYVAMVLDLPNVELMSNKKDDEAPLLFKFDGGHGAVMSMRCKYDTHIEIELSEAA